MEQETVTINGKWKIAKTYLEYSRFYQDLCHDTNSAPNELDIPNIFEGFEPDFEILIRFIKNFEIMDDRFIGYSVIITDTEHWSDMFFTDANAKHCLEISKRLDMPLVISNMISCLCQYRRLDLIKCCIFDPYILDCFLTTHPLDKIEELINVGDLQITRFLQNSIDKIVLACKKSSEPSKPNLDKILIRILWSKGICLSSNSIPRTFPPTIMQRHLKKLSNLLHLILMLITAYRCY